MPQPETDTQAFAQSVATLFHPEDPAHHIPTHPLEPTDPPIRASIDTILSQTPTIHPPSWQTEDLLASVSSPPLPESAEVLEPPAFDMTESNLIEEWDAPGESGWQHTLAIDPSASPSEEGSSLIVSRRDLIHAGGLTHNEQGYDLLRNGAREWYLDTITYTGRGWNNELGGQRPVQPGSQGWTIRVLYNNAEWTFKPLARAETVSVSRDVDTQPSTASS